LLTSEIAALAAGDAFGGADILPAQLRDDLLDRPPGANCTMTKEMTMIPNSVGIISSRRLRI
jgi:hypothetical protein